MGKRRKGGWFSMIFGVVMLGACLVLLTMVGLSLSGRLPAFLASAFSPVIAALGFGYSSTLALLPFSIFCGALGICTFLFRRRKPFSFLTFPLWILLFATANFFSGIQSGHAFPQLAYQRLLSDGKPLREAALWVVLLMIAELVVLVLLILLAKPLNAHYRKKQEFKAKQEAARLASQPEETAAPVLSKRQMRREEKRKAKEAKKLAKAAGKKGTSGDDVPEPGEERTTVVVPDRASREEALRFPSFMEVPKLDHLKRKNPEVPTEDPAPLQDSSPAQGDANPLGKGVVSLKTLEVIRDEVTRTNPIDPPPVAAADVKEKPVPRKTLSGFLQGALEAVGKAPKSQTKAASENTPSFGHGKGLLVEAVEENQRKHKDLAKMGSSFSKPIEDVPELSETPPAPLQQPAPVLSSRQPVFFTPSGPIDIPAPETPVSPPPEMVTRQERVVPPAAPNPPAPTSKPASQPVAQTPEKQEEAAVGDELQSESGVGGLSSANQGKSALLNRLNLDYHIPPTSILTDYPSSGSDVDAATVEKGDRLVQTLDEFHVKVELKDIIKGPTVTMFEIMPAPGVRVTQIENLADNIQLRLPATQVRIVAPIPGKTVVGVEIPNAKRDTVGFKEMIPAMDLKNYMIPMVLGRNLLGQPVVIDVSTTPHLLIAGATGSGKSVCVNSLICSILFRKSPKDVRLILVDPKIVELQIYNGIPHLLTPVITDPKRTLKALDFCLWEMERRYKLLQGLNARNILGYNEKVSQGHILREKLPYIVVIIDEFADLMHTVGKEMETKVSRLTAMSRAVGIHLVLATQRPSVNVITGIIKTNIPSRIAFAVTSGQDSRIIIEQMGAEKLLGKGDMLYLSSSDPAAARIQGAFLSDGEVERVVDFAKQQGVEDYIDESFFEDEPEKGDQSDVDDGEMIGGDDDNDDELMRKALDIVVERKAASASYLQRRLRIGYNRAARLVEEMEEQGYVGPANGSKPRPLLRYPGSVSLGQQDAGDIVQGGP
ncbi:MAG: DNA translocase FtsK [Sphaerochaeta sp.]|nr:DNA translocase FtsK [Sphaerochaeta sp.]